MEVRKFDQGSIASSREEELQHSDVTQMCHQTHHIYGIFMELVAPSPNSCHRLRDNQNRKKRKHVQPSRAEASGNLVEGRSNRRQKKCKTHAYSRNPDVSAHPRVIYGHGSDGTQPKLKTHAQGAPILQSETK